MAVSEMFIDQKDLSDFREFIYYLFLQKNGILLRNDINILLGRFYSDQGREADPESSIRIFFSRVQELFFLQDHMLLMHRYDIGRYRFYRIRSDGQESEEIRTKSYLNYKDQYVHKSTVPVKNLQIDYMPFYDYTPGIKDPRKIGEGITFLNRYLSSSFFNRPDEWNDRIFRFIKMHKYMNQQLLVNGAVIRDFDSFYEELSGAVSWLSKTGKDTPYSEVEQKLRKSGFEAGWGNTAGRICETMKILLDLINEPTDERLQQFIKRVPMPLISKIAIISPHGWFAQENVLGKPDTGGQVIYILDQVKALEKHLREEAELAGLNVVPAVVVVTRLIPDAEGTTCNVRKEKIYETENCWILRIPFRDSGGGIVNRWISRFFIWPYLDRFAEDANTELLSEFRGRPDLIIGNYSDGNLVASLLSDKLDVIFCTIAHALEKTKYLFSDMYWKNFEEEYNFSLQFTADMISMNKSDFIIASTHQEIMGNEESMGQYESYQFFTMPDLMQVRGGINLYAPKFNVIPPGVDERMYFPYYEDEKRYIKKKEAWETRLFSGRSSDIYGALDDEGKYPVFTMARFDRIKNITGLIEAFGMSEYLQEKCNLIFAAGTIHRHESLDSEEQAEIDKAYSIIEQYGLQGRVRWLPSINKIDTGIVYRIIADRKGVFVQPALFEAFGLTILEAMLSGLPTFGPMFGGPLEIIEEGINGYLLNTSRPELIKEGIEPVMRSFDENPENWDRISRAGVKRIREYFTWELYSEKLISQTKLYGFWRYAVSAKGKVEMDRYNDLIYHFLFEKRADGIL